MALLSAFHIAVGRFSSSPEPLDPSVFFYVQHRNMLVDLSSQVFRPISLLFNTPLFEETVRTCWYLSSHRTQIALVTELMTLQL